MTPTAVPQPNSGHMPTPVSASASASTPAPAPASASDTRPRILVPEKLSPDGLALLTPHFDVHVRTGVSPEELLRIIPDYQGLIVRSETKVTAQVLEAGKQLKVVARAGVGVDNIDVAAATVQGIIVINSPAGNIVAAAEHTVALLLATARHIGRADGGLKAGRWERGKLVGIEVGRKTLGIVGLGKVGLHVARMAKGIGMTVVAVDPYASADMARQAGVDLFPSLGEMLPVVDFLTVHTPLLATTMDLVGETELRSMKPTARVLNVARGGVYNEAALLEALDQDWIAGAGIDVFTSEPPEPQGAQKDTQTSSSTMSVAARLARHPKVVATPHLGASTVEAQENVSLDVCTQAREILRGGMPTSAVNAPIILPEQHRTLQPWVSLVDKMGRLYAQHFARGRSNMIGGRTFELVYHGELTGLPSTKPLLAALVRGLVAAISHSNVNIVNATHIARDKGITISETHAHTPGPGAGTGKALTSLVTLKSYPTGGGGGGGGGDTQVIEGYTSNRRLYISRLDRFNATFSPDGTLIILHNYDEPGKIGGVGSVLGSHGINIRFMQVAALGSEFRQGDCSPCWVEGGEGNGEQQQQQQQQLQQKKGDEALMILGIAGNVDRDVLEELASAEGVLDVSLVTL